MWKEREGEAQTLWRVSEMASSSSTITSWRESENVKYPPGSPNRLHLRPRVSLSVSLLCLCAVLCFCLMECGGRHLSWVSSRQRQLGHRVWGRMQEGGAGSMGKEGGTSGSGAAQGKERGGRPDGEPVALDVRRVLDLKSVDNGIIVHVLCAGVLVDCKLRKQRHVLVVCWKFLQNLRTPTMHVRVWAAAARKEGPGRRPCRGRRWQ